MPNPLARTAVPITRVVTNMDSKYSETDLGKCKLTYLRENWCLVAGRSLPNSVSDGCAGDSRQLIRQHFAILFGSLLEA